MEGSNGIKVKPFTKSSTTELIGRFGLLTPAIAVVPKIQGRDAVSQSFSELQGSNRDVILAAAHISDALTGRGRYGKARYYFKPRHAQVAFKIINNTWFKRLLYAVIVIHSGLVLIEPPSIKVSNEAALVAVGLNFFCLCLYVLDIVLVMIFVSWNIFFWLEEYFWNRVELVFVGLFFLDWIILIVQVSIQNSDLVQPFRCLRLAMLVCKVKNIGHIYGVVWSIFIKLGRAMFFGFVFILLYSSVGVHLLMPMYDNVDCSSSCVNSSTFCQIRSMSSSSNDSVPFDSAFDHVMIATLRLFTLLTTENYPDFIFPAYCENQLTFFYFGSFLFCGVFILTALLLAVIANIYWEYNKKHVKKERSSQRAELIKAWKLLDSFGQEKVSVNNSKLLLLFKKLKPKNTDEENLELIHALDCEKTGYITWVTWVTELLDILAYEKAVTRYADMLISISPSWWLPVKEVAKKLIKLKYFETVILVLIITHCLLFPLKWNGIANWTELLIQTLRSMLVTVFMMEMLLRVTAGGRKVLVQPFELTDFSLVFVGFATNLMWYYKFSSSVKDEELLKGISVVISSIVIFSRLFLNSSQTRRAMALFLYLIPIMLDLIALFTILMYLYAVVGMEAFHDVDMGNSVLSYAAYECNLGFQDFKCSLLMVFQIVTTNNWHDVMNSVIERTREYAAIYFVSCYIIVNLIFMNLLVAIGIEAFNRFSQLRNEEKLKTKEDGRVSDRRLSRQEDEVSAASDLPTIQYPSKRRLFRKLKSAASIAFGTTRSDYNATIPKDWTLSSPSRTSAVATPSLPGSGVPSSSRLARLPQLVGSANSSKVVNVIPVQAVKPVQSHNYSANFDDAMNDERRTESFAVSSERQKQRKVRERLQKRKHIKDHVTLAKVVSAFRGTNSNHLSLQEGENVKVLEEKTGWVHAESHSGKIGWLPAANIIRFTHHRSNKVHPVFSSEDDTDDNDDFNSQTASHSSNTWISYKKHADSLKPHAEAHIDQKKFHKGLNSNWSSHIQDVTVMNPDEFRALRKQLASSPVPQKKQVASSFLHKKVPGGRKAHVETTVFIEEDECNDNSSDLGNSTTLIAGTTNYPEVKRDNTETPIEDETALTEMFDKSSLANENRSKLQIPIEISVQVCDDVSDVLNSPDSEQHSGKLSVCSNSDSLQVPFTPSIKRTQAMSASKSDGEIPEWAQKLAAMYNKPIEEVNCDNEMQKKSNC